MRRTWPVACGSDKIFRVQPVFDEVLEGLLLSDGRLSRDLRLTLVQYESHRNWLDQVERQLWGAGLSCVRRPHARGISLQTQSSDRLAPAYTRWYITRRKTPPEDVQLTPASLAYWFSGGGAVAKNGYTLRLYTRFGTLLGPHVQRVFGWQPTVDVRGLRFAADRNAIAACIRPWLPYATILNVKTSERRPRHPLTPAQRACVLERATSGEGYQTIATDYGVTASYIGQLARQFARRHKPFRRLTRAEFEDVLLRLLAAEPIAAIARSHALDPARVAWIKRRYLHLHALNPNPNPQL